MSAPITLEHTLEAADPGRMHALGVTLGTVLRAGDLVILSGPLGAGKTTLSRGLGEGLGVRGQVTSPTFVLARTHPSLTDGPSLVHVDAYRLGGPEEFDDLDLDFERSVVVVEWGEGIARPIDSWLEIAIQRPTGASLVVHDNVAQNDAAQNDAAQNAAGPSDADETDDDPAEPRTLRVTGFGSRWSEGIEW